MRDHSINRPVVVMRLHEVALKGRNRRRFTRLLTSNVAYALRGVRYHGLKIRSGRILIELDTMHDWPAVQERVRHVFGAENYSLAVTTGTDLSEIRSGIEELLANDPHPAGQSYSVRVKRSDKDYPMSSPELEREIGAMIKQLTGAPVNLRDPDRAYQVEILYEGAYINSAVHRGRGGLPVGTSGRVVSLLSGGYDSPVAAYRMMNRGCEVTLIHCHAYPFVRPTSIEKVVELARQIGRNQPGMRLIVVPIGDAQRLIAVSTPPDLRVILYRRLMMRIAEAIATTERGGAIVTGESLGQVASQTLENIRTIEAAVELPVFRPLIGSSKEEIMAEARLIGTEPISREPDDDCCTVFVPRHPATHSTPEVAAAAEAAFDPEELVRQALRARTVFSGDPARWNAMDALQTQTAPVI